MLCLRNAFHVHLCKTRTRDVLQSARNHWPDSWLELVQSGRAHPDAHGMYIAVVAQCFAKQTVRVFLSLITPCLVAQDALQLPAPSLRVSNIFAYFVHLIRRKFRAQS